MRLRHTKVIVAIIIIANIILFYYSLKSTLWQSIKFSLLANGLHSQNVDETLAISASKSPRDKLKSSNKHLRKSITIVFRQFYPFENDLKASIDSILRVVPNMPIVVLQQGVPYPPINYHNNATNTATVQTVGGSGKPTNTVRFISLGFDIQKTYKQLDPFAAILTKFVLFMPDSVRLTSKNLLQKILREIGTSELQQQKEQVASLAAAAPMRRMLIVPFSSNIKSFSSCTQINLDLPNWTIQYVAVNSSDKCDLYLQKHAILIDSGLLKDMLAPFEEPFPELFYIQAKIANITKTIFPQSFQDGRHLFASYYNKQRRMDIRRRQFKEMYKKLQIKRIVRRAHKMSSAKSEHKDNALQNNLVLDTQFSSSNFSLPLVSEIDLIGCERTTKSCIGNVINNRPFYVHLGKHTPPCCMDKLKTTFYHVLEELENVGIRYWLDNYALKAAIDTQQLALTAYDIDIAFNVNDLERSNAMKKSQSKPFVDNDGFYWLKATDGHYFRVQFSKINQIGINLLPFEIAGNVVSPSGFFGWKAKKFSADYLHPMATVLFLDHNIMCPNNVREFLDYKNIN